MNMDFFCSRAIGILLEIVASHTCTESINAAFCSAQVGAFSLWVSNAELLKMPATRKLVKLLILLFTKNFVEKLFKTFLFWLWFRYWFFGHFLFCNRLVSY